MTDTTLSPPVTIPPRLAPYAFELRLQGSAARRAFISLEERLKARRELSLEVARDYENLPPLQMERDALGAKVERLGNSVGAILGDIQSFLSAVGVIEALLWPSETHYRRESDQATSDRISRGEELRALVGVTDPSPLHTVTRGPDDVRGGLLHYDEMLDEVASRERLESSVPLEISSRTEGTVTDRERAVRWLDEDSMDLWVAGRQRNLRTVNEALSGPIGRIQITGRFTPIRGPGPRRAQPPPPSLVLAPARTGSDLGR